MKIVSHRWRLGWGLLLGSALSLAVGYELLDRVRAAEGRSRAQREAVVGLRAVVDVIARAGGSGEPVRQAVDRLTAGDPKLEAVRVVLFRGISLEASSDPVDRGPKAAPRRLQPEEKPLYDLGQRLRAAVQTNRQEGSARKEVIEISPTGSGGLTLGAPLESEGEVVGLVEIRTAPSGAQPRARAWPALLALLAPLAVFLLLAALAGERRGLLLTVALLLFAGALFGYGFYAQRAIAADVRASEDLLAARVGQQAARAQEALRGIAVAGQPLDLSRWDVDLYGLPRGLIGAGATVNQARLQARLASAAGWVKQSMLGVALPGLLLLLLVGLGGAQRLGATLRKHREAYAYTLPALLGMLVLVFFPFLYGIALSFTDSNIYNSNKPISEIWVGLRNFIEILGDFNVAQRTAEGLVFNFQNFYWTLGFTIVWTISNVAIGVSVGLLLALILNTKGLKLRAAYRVLLILPWAVPNYITALTWKGMFHPQFGVVNQVIQMFGGGPIGWSDKTSTAFITILATNGWLSFPFMMVISLGALQSIPADLYEAATVDGASRWRQFRSITLPSLKPALIPAIILSVIWTFNMFNIPYLVSGGEPGHSTEILITQAYKFAFEQYRYGYAAAYSTVIFVILLIYGTWQNRVTRATEGL